MFSSFILSNESERIGGIILLREFRDIQDLKKFANLVSSELAEKNIQDLSLEIGEFSYNSYTTSSEYLGEYRIILKKILSKVEIDLNKETKEKMLKAIEVINKAFNNS